jgi:hypothetical protein
MTLLCAYDDDGPTRFNIQAITSDSVHPAMS